MAKKRKKKRRKPMSNKELTEHLKTNRTKTWGGKNTPKQGRRKSRLSLKRRLKKLD